MRICLNEFTPFGYDLDYGLQMVAALEATGLVDYFNADAGSFSSYWMEIPPAAVASADFDETERGSEARDPAAGGRLRPDHAAGPRRGDACAPATPISSAWRGS